MFVGEHWHNKLNKENKNTKQFNQPLPCVKWCFFRESVGLLCKGDIILSKVVCFVGGQNLKELCRNRLPPPPGVHTYLFLIFTRSLPQTLLLYPHVSILLVLYRPLPSLYTYFMDASFAKRKISQKIVLELQILVKHTRFLIPKHHQSFYHLFYCFFLKEHNRFFS